MSDLLESVLSDVARMRKCEETDSGVRIRTTRVLPPFESLFVYAEETDDGPVVHDDGAALGNMISRGVAPHVAKRAILRQCSRNNISFDGRRIFKKIRHLGWLGAAVIVVSATAAAAAVEKKRAKGRGKIFADEIFDLLGAELGEGVVSRNFGYQGKSGRRYKFDLAVNGGDRLTLISAVSPHPSSVNSKYVALADVGGERVGKFVAHKGDLGRDDIALLERVATVTEPNELVGRVAEAV